MEDMKDALKDIGLHWKKKKVRGNTCQSLKDWSNYKFLGVLKSRGHQTGSQSRTRDVKNVF